MTQKKGWSLATVIGLLLVSARGAFPFGAGDIVLTYNGNTIGDFLVAGGSPTATYRTDLQTTPGVFETSSTSMKGGGLAFDEQYQYLYVSAAASIGPTTSSNMILKFDANGAEVAAFTDSSLTSDLRGLAVRGGYVYAATDSGGVRKYDASTGLYQTTLGSINARSVAFDNSGTLYSVTATQAYQWNGSSFTSLGLTGVTDGHDLTFDRAGNLYVANGSGKTINKYTKIGTGFNATPTTISVPNMTSGYVFGLTYDPASDTFYASLATSQNINRIVTFNSGSSSTTDVSGTSGLTGPRWMEFNSTPEPSTITLFGVGALALHLRARRRKNALR